MNRFIQFIRVAAFPALLMAVMLLMCSEKITAQAKTVQQQQQVWLGYFNQLRFTNKLGLWADVHGRTKDDFFNGMSQFLARTGLIFYLTADARLTAGYAYIHHFPAPGHSGVAQPEHRPWQQVQWQTRYNKIRLMQWLRLEQRYRRRILNDSTLAPGSDFNFRIRFNILAQWPLSQRRFQPRSLSFVINEESFVNFGRSIRYNYFDQNRLFAGFHYHLSPHSHLQFGYMNVFQQLAQGDRYRSNHTVRVFLFQQLDLRKNENKH